VCVQECVCVTEKQGSHERESKECERRRAGEEEGGWGAEKEEKEGEMEREGGMAGGTKGQRDGV
jgi:hypothetical protein